ncbi:RNA-guided endonuclease IscB [Diaphorobacter sp. J5-51]|uniref:RNA-guided endonuclease IscB n=1 Tax=Diaphorobacter sp. J5-51 TaxID=680496 RepID=UPI000643626A|nr:RNA-guided endonuclease IscB [Diaphorobacter sp. J5-51]KLR58012.1 HNH endonuclease [Diaphorobacter sp. J5-51]
MRVFVLAQRGQPLMPCHPARARQLLRQGKAVVHRTMPLVIRLKDRLEGDTQPVRLKLDPGSKGTGLALVREQPSGTLAVLHLFELAHRGRQISEALTARRQMRRRRRGNLRHRAPRFMNRGNKSKGWLAPSLRHRVDTTLAWVTRLQRWTPLTAVSSELVRFDMQALQNPEISGIEYQQGTLAGYELREYLLEKWGRQCAYCGAQDTPLQIEHIRPRANGGSNRVSNLTLACQCCNQKKAALPVEVFLAHRPDALRRILAQARRPLKDAAAVNATRWALANALKGTGLPLELSSGGRTKFNRARLGVPKTHALDAACVGEFSALTGWNQPTLHLQCTGRGSYQRTRLDKFGFPRGYLMRQKQVKGFQTGDLVKAQVPAGKKAGAHRGRVAIRATGSFNIQTGTGVVQGISHRHCRLIQRADGYGYFYQPQIANTDENQGRALHAALSLPALKGGVSRA